MLSQHATAVAPSVGLDLSAPVVQQPLSVAPILLHRAQCDSQVLPSSFVNKTPRKIEKSEAATKI